MPRGKARASAADERCSCRSERAASVTGTGRMAAGVDGALKAANLRQLRRIEGQVAGLSRMIESDRYCADIITQISAVRESLRTVAANLLRNHLTHCAGSALASQGDARKEMVDELVELAGKLSM